MMMDGSDKTIFKRLQTQRTITFFLNDFVLKRTHSSTHGKHKEGSFLFISFIRLALAQAPQVTLLIAN